MIPTQQDMQQQKEAFAALKEESSRLDPQGNPYASNCRCPNRNDDRPDSIL